MADGRVQGPFGNSSQAHQVTFTPTAGHSYSIEVLTLSNAGVGSGVNINTGSCPTTNMAGLVNTTTTEPKVAILALRYSVTPTTNTSINVNIPAGLTVSLAIADTTLYNPSWSTFGGFFTQWGFQNTTDTAVAGTLTVRESFGGTATYSRTVIVNANSTTFVTTGDTFANGPIGSNRGGSATFTHNGPPGAILGDGYLIGQGNSVIVPTIFRTTRDGGR